MTPELEMHMSTDLASYRTTWHVEAARSYLEAMHLLKGESGANEEGIYFVTPVRFDEESRLLTRRFTWESLPPESMARSLMQLAYIVAQEEIEALKKRETP